jgi:hypothetical protein
MLAKVQNNNPADGELTTELRGYVSGSLNLLAGILFSQTYVRHRNLFMPQGIEKSVCI